MTKTANNAIIIPQLIIREMDFMEIRSMDLWDQIPGEYTEVPRLTAYIPSGKRSCGAVVIFAGGGYVFRCDYEGDSYARFLAEHGYIAFVCDYRVSPHRFPLPLLDARRAVQTVRYMADELSIDKNKIAVMGSSAGGHLAAMTSTYYDPTSLDINDDISRESFIPNAQILCYPVIDLQGAPSDIHIGSGESLLGDQYARRSWELSLSKAVSDKTPPAFIWHTFADSSVNIKNSLNYAAALKEHGINSECHFYPDGPHGLALCPESDRVSEHVRSWTGSLLLWLEYMGF